MSNSNPSQAYAILEALKYGRSLTALDALAEFGCFRLAARIHELRKEGHDIEEVIVSRNGKRYASYFIRESVFEQANLQLA